MKTTSTNTINILPMIGQVIVLTTTWGFDITGLVTDVHRDTSITMRAVAPSRRNFKEVERTYALDYEVRAWRSAKEGFDFNPKETDKS